MKRSKTVILIGMGLLINNSSLAQSTISNSMMTIDSYEGSHKPSSNIIFNPVPMHSPIFVPIPSPSYGGFGKIGSSIGSSGG